MDQLFSPNLLLFGILIAELIFVVGACLTWYLRRTSRWSRSGVSGYSAFIPMGCGAAIFLPVLFAFLMAVAPWKKWERLPAPGELTGHYRISFHRLTEILDMRDDGTFSQSIKFPDGRRFYSSGQWSLKEKDVTLDHYLHFDSDSIDLLSNPPIVTLVCGYDSHAHALYRGKGDHYYALVKK